jgi:hypothetical protein
MFGRLAHNHATKPSNSPDVKKLFLQQVAEYYGKLIEPTDLSGRLKG